MLARIKTKSGKFLETKAEKVLVVKQTDDLLPGDVILESENHVLSDASDEYVYQEQEVTNVQVIEEVLINGTLKFDFGTIVHAFSQDGEVGEDYCVENLLLGMTLVRDEKDLLIKKLELL